tara:strand:+ start:51639 stop:52955 length:1317 start_codon:yes stop_codon:yes gene_type:complete
MHATGNAPASVPFVTALKWWLRLGCISFGGPAGQIAIMHRELVEKRRWISESRFLHALNFCMVLPGPEAQQLATYIGWLMHGVRGGIAAGALFVLPSVVLLLSLAWAYVSLGADLAADVLYGIRPAVVAIILLAAWRMGRRILNHKLLWPLPLLAMFALMVQVPFPVIVVGALGLGWLMRSALADKPGLETRQDRSAESALINANSATPDHARFSARGLTRSLVMGVALVMGLLTVMIACLGLDALFVQLSLFFTKAALMTFGGAYAVMPYVYQGAVESYGWLSGEQMMDGLALGETTPGPLIIVVTFVGFLAAWQGDAGGTLGVGVMGGLIATLFTFLPSFIFIFAGAPWVERSRKVLGLVAPLRAVTAAVVGAILYLALFLAQAIFFPDGTAASIDGLAVSLTAGTLIAAGRYGLGLIPLILASAVIGGVLRFSML